MARFAGNLLPKSNLNVNGFDIAGKSVYGDETGGDYYDFISIEDKGKQKIGVAIKIEETNDHRPSKIKQQPEAF